LNFLKKSALSEDSSHSTLELAKFGFDHAQILGSQVPPAPLQNLNSNCNRLQFGSDRVKVPDLSMRR
jgi:hypothetical protein